MCPKNVPHDLNVSSSLVSLCFPSCDRRLIFALCCAVAVAIFSTVYLYWPVSPELQSKPISQSEQAVANQAWYMENQAFLPRAQHDYKQEQSNYHASELLWKRLIVTQGAFQTS